MRRRSLLAAGTALAAALAFCPAVAQASLDGTELRGGDTGAAEASYDVRRAADSSVKPTKDQLQAVSTLLSQAGSGTRVTWDGRFGTPRSILRYGGWLTGPRAGAATAVARGFVDDNRAALGLSAAQVQGLNVTGDHELPGTGTHVVTFAQTFDGVQATRGGSITVPVAKDGRIVSYAGATARDGALAGAWDLSSGAALEKVAGALASGSAFTAKVSGEKAGFQTFAKGPFAASSYVKKAAFPTSDGVRPAYEVLFIKELDKAWDTVVDAQSGKILYRSSLVAHESEGTVYENFPGSAKGGQPVIKSFGPTAESPAGYTDPSGLAGVGGPTTFGNNANTYANYSNFLVPADQGPRPVSPTSKFNYAYAQNWNRTNGETVPPSYAEDLDPAATNLFWSHNRIHDEYYDYGFTESAGNFQVNNNGGGGSDGDPILGLVHAGAASGGAPTYTGRDNAYMLTLPDGIPPWSGMFLWEPINDAFEGPYSDGNFDQTVIQHEYSHGLSNRYVSAEDGALNSHQSGSMGEGWGDWYALNHLYHEGLYNKSVVGEFATGNTERGIRNWSYDQSPTGFGDIGYDMVGAEVHADGEIWTTILWNMRKALVAKYGEAQGGEIAARLVTDAMPLSVVDPSFLDMRDAIIKALDNRYHARGDFDSLFDLVYGAFASRGAGVGAATATGDDTDPTPSFQHADPARNGTLVGKVVNASTGTAIEGARVMLGVLEARVSPVAETSTTGQFAVPATSGTYPVTIQAPGFGARTITGVAIAAGATKSLTFKMAPNLASKNNGAKVVSSTDPNADALIDDTEASAWKASKGNGNAVIELAKESKISSLQVSAFTTSRFEALKSFTLQTSTDGVNWKTQPVGQDAFSFQEPRPVVPDVHYKTFTLGTPVNAKFVRFYTDDALGETKTRVQAAELQLFSSTVKGVEPLPPSPPDEPVTDTGTIEAGNPGSDSASGVTMADLESACVVPPASQGADGWVTGLPDGFGDGVHKVSVKGESAAPYDMDLYFYDADCVRTGSAGSSAADESGTLPSGTKYVLTQLWLGANVPFTLTATDTE